MINKHEAVWEWLEQCPYIKDMYFNFSQSNNGDTLIIPQTSHNDYFETKFIDGSGIKKYDFALIQFGAFSTTANDKENIDILLDIEKVANWVEEQELIRNYPLFPNDCVIQEIFVLPSSSGYVAGQDKDSAKYMLQIQIEYIYRKEI